MQASVSGGLLSVASWLGELGRQPYPNALIHSPAAKEPKLVVRPVKARNGLLCQRMPAQQLHCARHPTVTALVVFLRPLVRVLVAAYSTLSTSASCTNTKQWARCKHWPDLYMARLPSPDASMQMSRSCGKYEQLQTVAPASVSRSCAEKPAWLTEVLRSH